MANNEFGLISVIMAAYNAEKTIELAIRSVLNQTYTNFELLVIDDGSTDNTVSVVQRLADYDSRVILIRNEKNSGVSYTRRYGLKMARGTWIAILDSDDAWKPEKLEKQVLLQQLTHAELLYTGSTFMDEDGKAIHWQLHVPQKIEYKKLLKQNLISNSSSLVKKTLYEQNYVMGNKMHEDYAIWLNILKSGQVAYGVDEPLLIYRIAKTSKSGNKIDSAKMNWRTYRACGLNILSAAYYEACYIFNGLKKYKSISNSRMGDNG